MLQKPFTVSALKEQFDKWTPFGQAMNGGSFPLGKALLTYDVGHTCPIVSLFKLPFHSAPRSNPSADVSELTSSLPPSAGSSGQVNFMPQPLDTSGLNPSLSAMQLPTSQPTSPGGMPLRNVQDSLMRFALSPAASDDRGSPVSAAAMAAAVAAKATNGGKSSPIAVGLAGVFFYLAQKQENALGLCCLLCNSYAVQHALSSPTLSSYLHPSRLRAG